MTMKLYRRNKMTMKLYRRNKMSDKRFRLKKPLYIQNKEYTVEAGYLLRASVADINVPEGVTGIRRSALMKATKIVTPATLESLQPSNFLGLHSVEEIDLSKSQKLTEIPGSAFAMCRSLKKIILPDSITALEGRLFSVNKLDELHIPSGITQVMYDTFTLLEVKRIITDNPDLLIENLTKVIKIPANILKAIKGDTDE